jgi:hypothetical protein
LFQLISAYMKHCRASRMTWLPVGVAAGVVASALVLTFVGGGSDASGQRPAVVVAAQPAAPADAAHQIGEPEVAVPSASTARIAGAPVQADPAELATGDAANEVPLDGGVAGISYRKLRTSSSSKTPTSSPTAVVTRVLATTPVAVAIQVTPTGVASPGAEPVIPLGWNAWYFNNTTLSGVPALSRNDGGSINFIWPDVPAPGVNADYFSVRWSQALSFAAGDYTFVTTHDDGGRLYIDGLPVIDSWSVQIPTTYSATVTLSAGTHMVQLDYYSTWGGAVAQLSYAPATANATTSISTTTAVPTATNTVAPTATNTPAPTVPATSTATPANTPAAAATSSATATPISTTTPTPTPTQTALPSATPVPPTATAAPPTATWTPTAAPVTATATASVGARDKYQWPFASTSIWNMPIGSGAAYVPAGVQPALGWQNGVMTTDDEFIGLNPNDPLKTLGNGLQVHVPASMQHDGSWNGVTALLLADGTTVAEGQPLLLNPGGNPSWAYDYGTVDLYGDGRPGAHGGSGLSSFGGSIRKGELNSAQPLHHVLKVNLFAQRFLSCSNGGYRWPAYRADGYMNCTTYGGSAAVTRMGSLLALTPDVNCDAVSSAHARKICHALQDYGAYVVDDTAWDVHAIDIEAGAEFSDGGTFDSDLQGLFTKLNVVDNNSASNIGGGGTPHIALAPGFSN